MVMIDTHSNPRCRETAGRVDRQEPRMNPEKDEKNWYEFMDEFGPQPFRTNGKDQKKIPIHAFLNWNRYEETSFA